MIEYAKLITEISEQAKAYNVDYCANSASFKECCAALVDLHKADDALTALLLKYSKKFNIGETK